MKKVLKQLLAIVCGFIISVCTMLTTKQTVAMASDVPGELLLGVFFNSEEDQSDTLYVSFNGLEFRKIGYAFEDRDKSSSENNRIVDPEVDYAWCLHDPCIQYYNGNFWVMSGYTSWDDSPNGKKYFRPMFAWSPDLVNWSYPNGGLDDVTDRNPDLTNAFIYPTVLPYDSNGNRENENYNVAAPDFLLDDDGTLWIVAPFGYYDAMNGGTGGAEGTDYMSPYLIKAQSITPGAEDLSIPYAKAKQPIVKYSDAKPINLPAEKYSSKNRIDSSLYKENGTYYLCIKENGITNEIWSIKNLDDCGNPDAWTLVNADVITGYEGPFMTKYMNRYYFFTDKLADYPYGNSDGTTGTFMINSASMSGGWSKEARIRTIDKEGNVIPNRHGSVITVTDPEAISIVMKQYYSAGWTYDPNTDKPSAESTATNPDARHYDWLIQKNGWFWYENGVRQGTFADPKGVEGDGSIRGREIADPNGPKDDKGQAPWYWLDSIYSGARAINKEVWMPYVYQDEKNWNEEQIRQVAQDSGDMAAQVIETIQTGAGKWVRYDADGRMIKGWYTVEGDDIALYPTQAGNTYYYDYQTGLMAKGWVNIDGVTYHFDETTGVRD